MTSAVQERPNNTFLGASLITFAMFITAVQDVIIKSYSSDLTLWQTFTMRGIFAVPMFVALAHVMRQHQGLREHVFGRWTLLRAFLLIVMYIAMYAAIPFISLSVIAAGIYTSPIFMTVMSASAIGERVSTRGWCAVLLGFIGVLLILQPGTDAFTPYALLPILTALMYASANLLTRSKCQDVPAAALALSLNGGLLLVGVVVTFLMLTLPLSKSLVGASPFIFGGWGQVSPLLWAMMVVLALLVVANGTTLAAAYKAAAPSTVATFDYSYLIFAVLFDFWFFALVPNTTTLIGIAFIVVAGLIATKKEDPNPISHMETN